MPYSNIYFDLDGTLTASAPGLINAFRYTLEKLSLPPADDDFLCTFIGPPIEESFRKHYGFVHEQSMEAVRIFREYYNDVGVFENSVYDGVPEMLAALKAAGKTLTLATSKPESLARRVLEHFGLDKYFDYAGGASENETRVKKYDVICYARELMGNPPPESIIMVGDRRHDVEGAAMAGIGTIGVLYGYGTRGELTAAGAAYLAETPADVVDIILKQDVK